MPDIYRAYDEYKTYVEQCEIMNEQPMDFDAWYDIILI
jgi:hypothetical protein